MQPTWIACPVRVAIENQKLLPDINRTFDELELLEQHEHSANQLMEHICNDY